MTPSAICAIPTLTLPALEAALAANVENTGRPVGRADDRGPQDHRSALHRHGFRIPGARRGPCDSDAGATGPAGGAAVGARPLQPDFYDARHQYDVPVRGAGDGGRCGLSGSADGGNAQHCVSAVERVFLLDVSRRRHSALDSFRPGYGTGRGLVCLCTAVRTAICRRQARRHLGADDHLHRSLGAGGVG